MQHLSQNEPGLQLVLPGAPRGAGVLLHAPDQGPIVIQQPPLRAAQVLQLYPSQNVSLVQTQQQALLIPAEAMCSASPTQPIIVPVAPAPRAQHGVLNTVVLQQPHISAITAPAPQPEVAAQNAQARGVVRVQEARPRKRKLTDLRQIARGEAQGRLQAQVGQLAAEINGRLRPWSPGRVAGCPADAPAAHHDAPGAAGGYDVETVDDDDDSCLASPGEAHPPAGAP